MMVGGWCMVGGWWHPAVNAVRCEANTNASGLMKVVWLVHQALGQVYRGDEVETTVLVAMGLFLGWNLKVKALEHMFGGWRLQFGDVGRR